MNSRNKTTRAEKEKSLRSFGTNIIMFANQKDEKRNEDRRRGSIGGARNQSRCAQTSFEKRGTR